MKTSSIAFGTGWGACMVLWGIESGDKVIRTVGAILVVFLIIADIGTQP